MSKFVTLHGFGGGGGVDLNFDIKAYGSEEEMLADSPAENTIGIITTTDIAGYRFSSTEPAGMDDGEVWICTDISSPGSFDVINGITLCPIYAMQMISGTLVNVEAKIYQNNGWVEWIDLLYREGYGLETNFIMGSTNSRIPAGNGITTDGFDWVRTAKKFDFNAKKYKKIIAKVYMGSQTYDYPLNLVVSDYTGQNNWINVSESSPPISPVVYSQIRHPKTNAENTIECNIETVTGQHYIGLGLGYHTNVIVREIYFER